MGMKEILWASKASISVVFFCVCIISQLFWSDSNERSRINKFASLLKSSRAVTWKSLKRDLSLVARTTRAQTKKYKQVRCFGTVGRFFFCCCRHTLLSKSRDPLGATLGIVSQMQLSGTLLTLGQFALLPADKNNSHYFGRQNHSRMRYRLTAWERWFKRRNISIWFTIPSSV